MSQALGLLGFVSMFQIMGGIALGWVLRRLIAREFNARLVFFFIWGSMFGLAPLGMGASSYAAIHANYLILVQVSIFLATIAITAFTPQEYFAAFASLPILFIAFGGVLLLIGAAAFVGQFRQDLINAVLVGGVFALVGGVFLAVGLVTASKDR